MLSQLLYFSPPPPPPLPSSISTTRACLPFPPERANYHQHLNAAISVVQKACRLCVDVKRSLSTGDGKILEKTDQTPVTIADFSVQALVSLELNREFPSIPLVAEEDASSLRSPSYISSNTKGSNVSLNNSPLDSILSVVAGITDSGRRESLTKDDVLEAIDRGGKTTFASASPSSAYWILDPIDGTRGFLKGSESLYVVGLALVVDGEVTLGVMGCPNWNDDISFQKPDMFRSGVQDGVIELGVIMISHVGCGTWIKKLSRSFDVWVNQSGWSRCYVDHCSHVHEARFCIPESQSWNSLPLSSLYDATIGSNSVGRKPSVVLLSACCGSLCKYLMVASGRASIFIQRVRRRIIVKAWDHAVGVICVEEAGGQVTDWKGHELDLMADEVGRRAIFPAGGILVKDTSIDFRPHRWTLEQTERNLCTVIVMYIV